MTEPEQPTQLPTEPAPDVPMGEPPPPSPPDQTDVRTTELLERRAHRQADADQAREAMERHNRRALAVRDLITGDMGDELAGRYEDLARVSDAMGKAARRVWKYQEARVNAIDTELGTPPP